MSFQDTLTWLNEHWYVYIIIGVLLMSFIAVIVAVIARAKSSSSRTNNNSAPLFQPLRESLQVSPVQTPRETSILATNNDASVPQPYNISSTQQQQQRPTVTYETLPSQRNQYQSIPMRERHGKLPPMPTSPRPVLGEQQSQTSPSSNYQQLPAGYQKPQQQQQQSTTASSSHYSKAPPLLQSTYTQLPERPSLKPIQYGRLSDVTLNPQQYQQQRSDTLQRQINPQNLAR